MDTILDRYNFSLPPIPFILSHMTLHTTEQGSKTSFENMQIKTTTLKDRRLCRFGNF